MPSLIVVRTSNRLLLLEPDGRINGPLTWFVNENYDNPHTRDVSAAGLRILHRFLHVYAVDLPARALNSECLRAVECRYLRNMAYLSLPTLDRMSDKMVKRATSQTATNPKELTGAVEQNTAVHRLETIAAFLDWYRAHVLHDAIRSPLARDALKTEYIATSDNLTNAVNRTPRGHHNIRSLPVDRYLAILREVFVNPEALFLTDAGVHSSTMMRDRAIALLAMEGLRPGAIGNASIADFRFRPGDAKGYMMIKDNSERRERPLTTGTPLAKGTRSVLTNYNSEISVKLWPFTCLAIQEYIVGERAAELSKVLENRSKSMLFVKGKGAPIGHRTTISVVFARLGWQLKKLGLLDVAKNDPFSNGKTYDFSAYTLRHSAATFFYAENKQLGDVIDRMKARFGWTEKSDMPNLYAQRSQSEAASTDMSEFYDSLLQARAEKRKAQSTEI